MKRLAVIAVLALLCGLLAAVAVRLVSINSSTTPPPKPQGVDASLIPRFTNIASRIGLDGEHKGDTCSANAAGAAWIDLDRKGSPELALGSYTGWNVIWSVGQNQAEPVANLGRIPEATGLSAADYDNDGWEDLLVSTQRGPRLFRNTEGRLVDVTARSGLKPHKLGMAAAWGDMDRDGLLDLALTQGNNCVAGVSGRGFHFGRMRLYRQSRPGYFTPADSLLTREARPALGMALAWTDLNNDGLTDLYLGNDYIGGVRNQAFLNTGDKLVPGFLESEIKINSMGIGLGDLNGDLRTDLAISNIQPINTLTNLPSGFKRERLMSASPNRLQVTWGLFIEDFNNDGWEDIWSSAGGIEGNRPSAQVFYLNQGKGRLIEVAAQAGLSGQWRGRSPALVDLNKDGLMDVAMANLNQRPALYLNQGSKRKGRWLQVTLTGNPEQRSPRTPCGAKVVVRVGSKQWMRELECSSESFLATSEKLLHFGFGQPSSGKAAIKVVWPGGGVQRVSSGLDRRIAIFQSGGIKSG